MLLFDLLLSAVVGALSGLMLGLLNINTECLSSAKLACCPSVSDILNIAAQGDFDSVSKARELFDARKRLSDLNDSYKAAAEYARRVASDHWKYIFMVVVALVTAAHAQTTGGKILSAVVFAAAAFVSDVAASKRHRAPNIVVGSCEKKSYAFSEKRGNACELIRICEQEENRVAWSINTAVGYMNEAADRVEQSWPLYQIAALVYIIFMSATIASRM